MKAYGYYRRDKLECKYGCCTLKGNKHQDNRKKVDMSRRKTARRFFCEE